MLKSDRHETKIRTRGLFLFVGLMAHALVVFPAAQRQPPPKPPAPKPPAAKQQPDYFQWLKSRQDLQDLSRLVLKNGVKLLVAENHESNLAVLGLHFSVGRGLPGEGDYWAAPLALRMLFAGTQRRTARQIADQLWAYGVRLQLECRADESLLWVTFQANQASRVVEFFADLLIGPLFPEAALAEAQASLLQEEGGAWADMVHGMDRRRPAAADAMAFSDWAAVEKGIQGTKLSQVQGYWNRARLAGNMTVLLYGDFLPESLLDLTARRFKDVPAAKEEPTNQEKKSASSPALVPYRQIRSDISRAVLRISYPMPAEADADYPAIVLASYFLAEGRMSYLNRHLVEDKKVAHLVKRWLDSGKRRPGNLYLQLETGAKDLDTLEIEFFTAMQRWRGTAPTEGEVSRALALAIVDFWGGLETLQQRGGNFLDNELLGGYKTWTQRLDRLMKVKSADMARVAEKYFAFERCEVSELLPINAEPRNYTAASFRDTLTQILSASGPEAPAEPGDSTEETAPADFSLLAKKYAPAEIPPVPYRTSILRGPELQIWELHSSPVVDVGIFYPGSLEKELPGKSGMTYLMLASLLRNSSKITFEDRFRMLERWGGRIEPVIEKDFYGYRLRLLAPFAEKAMDLVLDVVRNKDFLDQDVQQEWRLANALGLRRHDNPRQALQTLLDHEVYGEHPYSRDPFLLAGTLAGLKAADIKEWYQELMEDVLPMVVVVGDTPGTSLATYFAKHYSGSKYKSIKSALAATTPPKEAKEAQAPPLSPAEQGTAVSFLGPEGENEETLLMQIAMIGIERALSQTGLPNGASLDREPVAELRAARKGGRISIIAGRDPSDGRAEDSWRQAIEELPASISREMLERDRANFLARARVADQDRSKALLKLAVWFYSQGQFYTPKSLTQRAEAVTTEEYVETTKRYLSQPNKIVIHLGP